MTYEMKSVVRREAIVAAIDAAEAAIGILRTHLSRAAFGTIHHGEEVARAAEAFTSLAVAASDCASGEHRAETLKYADRAMGAANRVRYAESRPTDRKHEVVP